MTTIIISLIIFVALSVCLALGKKNAKKKEEQEKKDFQNALLKHIQSYKDNEQYFSDVYEFLLKEVGLEKEILEIAIERIPHLKKDYSAICQELLDLSETNIFLFDEKKLEEAKKKSMLTQEKIALDMIQILPLLSRYSNVYSSLHEDIYMTFFTDTILPLHYSTFRNVLKAKEDFSSEEEYDKAQKEVFEKVYIFQTIEINRFIKKQLNLPSEQNIRESTDPNIQKLISYANSIDGLSGTFFDIWLDKMSKIGRRYEEIGLDLYEYFKDIDKKAGKRIDFYDLYHTALPKELLSLKEYIKQNCPNVYNLYSAEND